MGRLGVGVRLAGVGRGIGRCGRVKTVVRRGVEEGKGGTEAGEGRGLPAAGGWPAPFGSVAGLDRLLRRPGRRR